MDALPSKKTIPCLVKMLRMEEDAHEKEWVLYSACTFDIENSLMWPWSQKVLGIKHANLGIKHANHFVARDTIIVDKMEGKDELKLMKGPPVSVLSLEPPSVHKTVFLFCVALTAF